MNINQIIEIKKEFTIQLTNILSPLIFQGISSIYNELIGKGDETKILKNFQSLLLNIKNWNMDKLTLELNRILLKTKDYSYFLKLIQAVFKTNQIILGVKISETLKNELSFGVFIHHIYIECAREFYADPFLFYHNQPLIEIKRNNNIIILKINNCIETAIRRLMPMASILDAFLGDKAIDNKTIDNINNIYNIPLLLEVSYDNINETTYIKNNTDEDKIIVIKEVDIIDENMKGGDENMKGSDENMKGGDENIKGGNENMKGGDENMKGGDIIDGNNTKINILNILDKQSIKLSDSNDGTMLFTNKSYKNNSAKSSTLKNIIENVSQLNTHASSVKLINSAETKLILKDLESESTYHVEANNENYQDIFSNTEIKKNSINTLEKNDKKTRQTFFNNYLNI